MQTIGFAGLGRMGSRMAANIARAGFPLVLYNRSTDRAVRLMQELTGEGFDVRVAETPADLAASADGVLTMLADDAASRSVFGALAGKMDGRIFCEMGTVSPQCVADHAALAHANGGRFVDAPVSGATQAAENATLLIMAGGDAADVDALRPVFGALGRATVHVGPSGAGATMKLAVNMMLHALNQTLAEALVLAEAGGIARERAYSVIEQSAAAAPLIHYRKPLYLDEGSHPVAFALKLAMKDVDLALAMADAAGRDLPQTRLNGRLLAEAVTAGLGERDMAAMAAFMRERGERVE